MKSRNIILGVTMTIGIFFVPNIALGALDLVTFSTNPQTPGPNQPVTVSIQSYAIDLNSSRITWYVDKEAVADGVAEKSIRTETKGFGKTVTINVVIVDAGGARFDKEFLLHPIEIDLLWEADTYTPPFYKGKALPTYKSVVKATAIPRMYSTADDPALFFYEWTINRIQGVGKGLGKGGALIPMKYAGSPVPTTVKVSDPNVEGSARSVTQNILAVEPTVLFYEQAPLLGTVFDRALTGTANTEGTTFRVRATPYFFSNDNMANGELVYTWQKDGATVAVGLNPNSLELGKAGTATQSSKVGLTIQNRSRILQKAGGQVTINFSQE